MAPDTPVRPAVIPPEAPSSASADTLLVPRETSEGLRAQDAPAQLPACDHFQQWLHGGWQNKRSKIYDGLTRTAQTNARRYAFCQCGAGAMLQRREVPGSTAVEWRVRSTRCHDRLCDPCAHLRAWDIQRALHGRMKDVSKPMLVTLTLVSSPRDPLAAKIDELYKSFRYLRDHPLWARACRGGAAFLEVTRGKLGDRWHAHFHIVCDCDYIDFYALQAVWKTITKGAFRIRLERPKAGDGTAYSAKYAAKGVDFNVCETPDLLDETIMALKGRRLCFCFGDWYKTSFAADIEEEKLNEDDTAGSGWTTMLTFQAATAAALAGDDFARAALLSTPQGRAILQRATAPPV